MGEQQQQKGLVCFTRWARSRHRIRKRRPFRRWTGDRHLRPLGPTRRRPSWRSGERPADRTADHLYVRRRKVNDTLVLVECCLPASEKPGSEVVMSRLAAHQPLGEEIREKIIVSRRKKNYWPSPQSLFLLMRTLFFWAFALSFWIEREREKSNGYWLTRNVGHPVRLLRLWI